MGGRGPGAESDEREEEEDSEDQQSLTEDEYSDDEDEDSDNEDREFDDEDQESTSPTLQEASTLASVEQDDENNLGLNREDSSAQEEQVRNHIGIRLVHLYNQQKSPGQLEKMKALIKEGSGPSDLSAKLAVVYFEQLQRHEDESNEIWECPERISAIYESLKSSGILNVATVLKEERRATEQDVMRAHSKQLWEKMVEYDKEITKLRNNEKKRKNYNVRLYKKTSLYVNEFTMDCALLGAGSLLAAVDHMLTKGGVVFSDDRPPGKSSVALNFFHLLWCCFGQNTALAWYHGRVITVLLNFLL